MKKLRKRSGTGSVARFITATQLADFAARLSGIGRTADIEWLRERGRAGIVEHRRHARNAKRFAE